MKTCRHSPGIEHCLHRRQLGRIFKRLLPKRPPLFLRLHFPRALLLYLQAKRFFPRCLVIGTPRRKKASWVKSKNYEVYSRFPAFFLRLEGAGKQFAAARLAFLRT